MEYVSENVAYHPHSPDELVPECQNTGDAGDGVVFLGFEPMLGAHSFVGRRSIIEAVALLYKTTPDDVLARLTAEAPAKKTRRKAAPKAAELD